jgi:hypothetical protein
MMINIPNIDMPTLISRDPITFGNELYIVIDFGHEMHGDLRLHNVIYKRQSDNKYFRCTWSLQRFDGYDVCDKTEWIYEYEPEWVEVKAKTITIYEVVNSLN